MATEIRQDIIQIYFQGIENGLQEVKTTAARQATELADEGHRKLHDEVVNRADGLDVPVMETQTTRQTLSSHHTE